MSNPANILESLQQECADRLLSLPYFANIPVFVMHQSDIGSEFERALGAITDTGGKSGVCVVIDTPDADVSFPDIGGPFFDRIPITAIITENPTVNNDPATGVGQSCLSVAVNVAFALHQFFPASANAPIIPTKPTIPKPLHADDGTVVRNVNFTTQGGVRQALPQIAPVSISETAGVVTLTTSTPGAAIFYTLNGSNASPRNAAGVLYTAPFTPGVGLPLNARAWLAGYLASEKSTTTT